MAEFAKEITKALNFVTPRQLRTFARGSLKKYREVFIDEMYKYAKEEFKLLRPLYEFARRFKFFAKPKDIAQGVSEQIFSGNTQFSFLAVPHSLKQNKRKDGTFGKRIMLDRVRIGKKFKNYENVFVQTMKNNNRVPLRTGSDGKLRSMNINIINMETMNTQNFDDATEVYSEAVMEELGKRIIRGAARNLNKTVKFRVKAGSS